MRTKLSTAVLLLLIGCGASDSTSEAPASSSTASEGAEEPHSHPPFEYEEVVASLEAIETPLRPSWESEVRGILLETYDDDVSGELDTDGEVNDVPCEVWRAVNDGYRDRAPGDESVRDAYGFAPDTLYIDSLGVHRSQREQLRVQLLDCGVR